MSDARFVIRTSSGDKGPFTAAQIGAYIRAGKLPGQTRIFDQQAQQPIIAADAAALAELPPSPAESPFAAEAEQLARAKTETVAAPAAAAAPAAPASETPSRPTTSRATRPMARRATGAGSGSSAARRGRTPPRSGMSKPLLFGIIGGAVALIAVAVVLVVVLRGGGGSVVGDWKIDVAATIAKAEETVQPDAVGKQMATAMLTAMAEAMRFEFRADGTGRFGMQMGDQSMGEDFRWREVERSGSSCVLEVTSAKDGKVKRMPCTFRGDRLELQDPDGKQMQRVVLMRR